MRRVRALVVLKQHEAAITAQVKADVTRVLDGEALSPSTIADAAERAHAALDAAGHRALARGAEAPVCAAGCSYCCHVHADATVPELLSIARHLESAWSEAERAALRGRLALQVSRVERLSDEERWAAKIPARSSTARGGARSTRCGRSAAGPSTRAASSLAARRLRGRRGRAGADPSARSRARRCRGGVRRGAGGGRARRRGIGSRWGCSSRSRIRGRRALARGEEAAFARARVPGG